MRSILNCFLSAVAAVMLFPTGALAQQSAKEFVQVTNYLMYYPQDYDRDTSARWPLVLFLHGAGERGEDLNKLKFHGPAMKIEQGEHYPFLVISPQLDSEHWEWEPTRLFDLVRSVVKENRVDQERIYVTGLSMGGFGTWKMIAEYPNYFAAALPICGGGDPETAWKMKFIPIWTVHGQKDNIVPIASTERIVEAVKKYNPDIKFTVYPDIYHDSWVPVYDSSEWYEWLLSHKRFHFTEQEVPVSELEAYVGEYEVDGMPLVLAISEGRLTSSFNGRNPTPLNSHAQDLFYFHPDYFDCIEFTRDAAGNVIGGQVFNSYQTMKVIKK